MNCHEAKWLKVVWKIPEAGYSGLIGKLHFEFESQCGGMVKSIQLAPGGGGGKSPL